MATVVVVLPASPPGSSKPRPIEVMMASVVSGVISEMAPTSVVLPTPKPPATMIFTAVIRLDPGRCRSEVAESNENPFQYVDPLRRVAHLERLVQGEDPLGDHVGDQHPGHAERHPQRHGDLGQRLRAVVAERGDELTVPPGVPA